MDLEETTAAPKFTFTSELMQAVKWINENDGIEEDDNHNPIFTYDQINGNSLNLDSDMVRQCETRDMLIFAFSCFEKERGTTLTIYFFSKDRGQN